MTIEISNILQVFLIAAVASTVLSSGICLTLPKQKKVEVEI
ncbi:MAG: hypothetical protein QNJ47_27085 [Nostocaceae cyanobacterium]|nr:hypothetical protein [Nostocaceae cyanobacterium]